MAFTNFIEKQFDRTSPENRLSTGSPELTVHKQPMNV